MKSMVALAAGLGWCAWACAQVPPSPADYAAYTGLFAAAARNDTAKIVKLLAAGDYAGIRDAHGRTPLHVATYRRRHDAMRVLAGATGDPNALDADGYDIVTIAAVANDIPTLRVALTIGCSPRRIAGPDGDTALIAAAERGHEVAVRTLLQAGAPIDYVNKRGYSALSSAIVRGDGGRGSLATVKRLVAAGANVNLADSTGSTPVDLARARGYGEMVAVLQGAGAAPAKN